jgi:hypothetical protein
VPVAAAALVVVVLVVVVALGLAVAALTTPHQRHLAVAERRCVCV